MLLVLIVYVTAGAIAQVNFNGQQLDNSNGLSNSCINDIFEDSDHLMWFGTWDGLNVYDGNSFHVFNYGKANLQGNIASNVIYHLGEDNKKNIWIATIAGVSQYNKQAGKFSHYFYNHDKSRKVIDKGFLMAINKAGQIYCTLKSGETINYYDAQIDDFRKCNIHGAPDNKIIKLLFDHDNKLWILTEEGLVLKARVDKGSITVEQRFQNSDPVTDLYAENGHVLYITTSRQLFDCRGSAEFKKVANLPYTVRAINFYKGSYIIAWSTIGVTEMDSTFKPTNTLLKAIPSLSNIRVTSLHSNHKDILWIGTDGNGVLKIKEKDNHFGLVKQLPDGRNINIPIRAFNEIDGNLWIGTKGNGIIQIKNIGKPGLSSSFIRSFHSNLDILDNCVYSIEKNPDGFAYIGSDAFGITLYDLNQKTWTNWSDIEGSKNYALFKSVHCIITDCDSSVWLGTESYGLIHLKIKRNGRGRPAIEYLQRYNYTGDSRGPGNSVIYTLALGSRNVLWVGCRYGGLSLFDKKTKKFQTFKAFSYTGSLSNNDVLSLYVDRSRRLWVGTSYGLNYINEKAFDRPDPIFGKITAEQGLPNNTIHTITQDNEGFIWSSTNKGLVKINPSNLRIVRFKEADGLQSNEFSDNAVWRNSKGYLFFGGIYGFNYFLPATVKLNNAQPNLLITELQLAGKQIDEASLKVLSPFKSQPVSSYDLAPQDNFFELKVKAIDFSGYDKCQYAYFLEGNDKVWHYLQDNSIIALTNLSPGNYTLKVKWSNGDGVWTKPIPVLQLHIRQFFWLTWPALMLYILILGVAYYLFYRYRHNKLAMQHRLVTEHLLREKDEQLHQEQLNFFTNIAHELQTPLTLILGALERFFIKNKDQNNKVSHSSFLSIVNEQASRLNYLVYQLLEFRKAETGHLANSYNYLNVSVLMANIVRLFSDVNDPNKLSFTSEIEPGIMLWMDKDKVEKIVFNLLSNAFKHSSPAQVINFSVTSNPANDFLQITIANSGCKLSTSELDSLFNKFFVVDKSSQTKISTGIGLAFTRELVTLLNGNINVSLNGDWIEFKVNLPLSYVPHKHERAADSIDKLDKPSYLLHTVAVEQLKDGDGLIAENNKNALINSVDNTSKKSVLIIEDEPSIRFLLRDILKENYLVYEAGDGKEALEIIRRVIPSLIISDIMMPDMSGLDVCNIIKTTPETCHIPFIMLSARGTLEQKTEGYEAGADAYIPKPFQSEYLLVRIRKLLDYQQKLHDLFAKDQIISRLPEAGMKDSDKEFLEQTIALIETHLDDENLDAAFLEEKLAMSKANFYRKLKALSSMTPGELIKSIRLQQAALLLEKSEHTVSEIFYKTGFSNQSHFYREFKKKYQCSPNEYRSKFRLTIS